MKKLYIAVTVLAVVTAAIIGLSQCGKPSDTPEKKDMPEIVDLGLSVKWADRNLGASSSYEYGDYFAWGETKSKATYYWDNYKFTTDKAFCDESYSANEWLKPEDDAATAALGAGWRMPTYDEMCELVSKCMWERVMRNGVNCYKVTSKVNGNCIYLPLAGFKKDAKLERQNRRGYYWASERSMYSNTCGNYLNLFSLENDRGIMVAMRYRNQGLSVRPVYDAKIK